MSFVSWCAPTTTVPSPLPGMVAMTFAVRALNRDVLGARALELSDQEVHQFLVLLRAGRSRPDLDLCLEV